MESSGYRSDTTLILSDSESSSGVVEANQPEATASLQHGTTTSHGEGEDGDTPAHSLANDNVESLAVNDEGEHQLEYDYDIDVPSEHSSHDFASERDNGPGIYRAHYIHSGNEDEADGSGSEHSAIRSRCSSAYDEPSSEDEQSTFVNGERRDELVFEGCDRSEIGDGRRPQKAFTFLGRYATRLAAENARDMFEGYKYAWHHNFSARKRKTEQHASARPSLPSAQAQAWDPRTSLKRMGIHWTSAIYVCVNHVDCEHSMQIATFHTDPQVFELSVKGEHKTRLAHGARAPYGIHTKYRQRVSDMVLQNYYPSAIHTILLKECFKKKDDFSEVPEVKQIQNVLSYKQRTLVYTVDHVNDLLVWVRGGMCETEADFNGSGDQAADLSLHDLIVLKWFEHEDTLKAVKAAISDILRANTARVLAEGLPRILLADGRGYRAARQPIRHYCSGPTPTEMFIRSHQLQHNTGNYHIHSSVARARKKIHGYVFNSRETMLLPDGAPSPVPDPRPDPITPARAKIFLESLRGRARRGMDFNTMYSAFGSLPYVKILNTVNIEPIPTGIEWTLQQIEAIRAKLRCECRSLMQTGWMCSHVLASLGIMGVIDTASRVRAIPTRRPCGRPPGVTGGLTRDDVYGND